MNAGQWSFIVVLLINATNLQARLIHEAINQFSVEILQTMDQRGTSTVIVSPTSVYTLLAFIQQGCHGYTRDEITHVLHNTPSQTLVGYHNLTSNFLASQAFPAVWKGGQVFRGEHIKNLAVFYGKSVLNFITNFGPAFYFLPKPMGLYEDWFLSGLGNSSMTELVTEFSAQQDEDPRFLLFSNKISFEGFWRQSFEERNMTFSPAPDKMEEVSGMFQNTVCVGGVSKKLGAKWIRLDLVLQVPTVDYADNFRPEPVWSDKDVSLLLLLPTKRHKLSELLKNLRPQQLSRFAADRSNYKSVRIQLPQFHLHSNKNLIPTLKEMGLNVLFEDSADLGGIVTYFQKVGSLRSNINIIVDKNSVRTNKFPGLVQPTLMTPANSSNRTLEFTADQPFLYFIMDNSNNIPIIAGKMAQPYIQTNT